MLFVFSKMHCVMFILFVQCIPCASKLKIHPLCHINYMFACHNTKLIQTQDVFEQLKLCGSLHLVFIIYSCVCIVTIIIQKNLASCISLDHNFNQ